MKRISLAAPLLVGLSLLNLTCQRAAQPQGSAATAGAVNSSNATRAGAESQPPTAPQTQLKVGDQAPDFTLKRHRGPAREALGLPRQEERGARLLRARVHGRLNEGAEGVSV